MLDKRDIENLKQFARHEMFGSLKNLIREKQGEWNGRKKVQETSWKTLTGLAKYDGMVVGTNELVQTINKFAQDYE